MPTYQYRCSECGHFFEQVQSFSDDALTECPQCQGVLRKVFNAVGVVFKGSGFYKTDSRPGSSNGAGSGSSNGSTNGAANGSSGSGSGEGASSSSDGSGGSTKSGDTSSSGTAKSTSGSTAS